ncbi:hypothetical protein EfmJHP36_32850 (plasmid) [Enterococcus faecium]|nr:hypothetical protein EfmJHP36_32850 [Enterococcus faecium]
METTDTLLQLLQEAHKTNQAQQQTIQNLTTEIQLLNEKVNYLTNKLFGRSKETHWKLLQKEEAKLNYEKRVWRASFKDYLTESEIADRLLAACPNLRQGYQLYQDILYAVKKRDQSLFEDCLTRDISGLPETRRNSFPSVKKFLSHPQNALHYSYSNGPLECLNNHIKVLKRNAYGFRNFYNFKLRIMIRHSKTFLTPAYRQENYWKQTHGLDISRDNITNWHIKAVQNALDPLGERLRVYLNQEEILHGDETSYRVIESAKTDTYYWQFCTGKDSQHPLKELLSNAL